MSILITALVGGVLLSACGQAAAATSAPAGIPGAAANVPGAAGMDGAALLAQRCGQCHSAGQVVGLQGTAAQWKQLVDIMISQGAQLTPEEEQVLVAYLAANFHP